MVTYDQINKHPFKKLYTNISITNISKLIFNYQLINISLHSISYTLLNYLINYVIYKQTYLKLIMHWLLLLEIPDETTLNSSLLRYQRMTEIIRNIYIIKCKIDLTLNNKIINKNNYFLVLHYFNNIPYIVKWY